MNFTHEYTNERRRIIKCFIVDDESLIKSPETTVIVHNEFGKDKYIKYSKLKEI